MLFPLTQGETNTDSSLDALHYGCAFRTFITDLRRHQRGSASPFYFVLLAPAHNATAGSLPLIQGWQSQLQALTLPNTAIANTIDLGDNSPLINELHPRNKSLIGQRLARIALSELYGQTMVTRGPTLLLDDARSIGVTRVNVSGSMQLLRVVLVYPALAENSLLHVMGTAECESCCDGVSSALFGLREANSTATDSGAVYWPSRVDIDVEHHTVSAVLALPASVKRVRVDFENAVSYPECALYNADQLPALPFSVEVDVNDVASGTASLHDEVVRAALPVRAARQ